MRAWPFSKSTIFSSVFPAKANRDILDGLTSQALAERLRVADKVTRKLIACGHLRTVTAINPVNRCPVTIVPTEEIERFEAEFVTLFSIARQQGRHHLAVKKDIEAAGVKPAMTPEKVGATIYRRSDIAAFGGS